MPRLGLGLGLAVKAGQGFSLIQVDSSPEIIYLYIEQEGANLQLEQDTNSSAYVVVSSGVADFNVSFDTDLPYIFFTNVYDAGNFNNNRIDVSNFSEISSSYVISPTSIYVTTSGASISAVNGELYTFVYFNTGSLILGFDTGTTTSLNSISSYPTRKIFLEPSNFYLNPLSNTESPSSVAYQVSASWVAPVADSYTGPLQGYRLQSRQLIVGNTWTSWQNEISDNNLLSPSLTSITFTSLSGGSLSSISGGVWDVNSIYNPAVLTNEYNTPPLNYELPIAIQQQFRLAAVSFNGVGQWAEPINTFYNAFNGRTSRTYINVPGNNTLSAGTTIGAAQDPTFCDPSYSPEGRLIYNRGYIIWFVADGYSGWEHESRDCILDPILENHIKINNTLDRIITNTNDGTYQDDLIAYG